MLENVTICFQTFSFRRKENSHAVQNSNPRASILESFGDKRYEAFQDSDMESVFISAVHFISQYMVEREVNARELELLRGAQFTHARFMSGRVSSALLDFISEFTLQWPVIKYLCVETSWGAKSNQFLFPTFPCFHCLLHLSPTIWAPTVMFSTLQFLHCNLQAKQGRKMTKKFSLDCLSEFNSTISNLFWNNVQYLENRD